ncbi:hypothetical protein DSM106972_008200 [Dulcicalothrix desertica PCC 7102]|uniref:Uncharacterized protein n=1 Tax=Dulcicalothrix desertica PCC 7102 TaxID=232991 RepID=A0A3S1CMB8_9CYAN|nr:hypothetical protein [Dulcicalothrix desertica]RUT10325.1 hypothetical protein DSM106972_008200 [Dulcicalothrix desertica PCC 7102]TWH40703.1 hypothetical protein CAL7102_10055 [Dulcicalothrix desertica PCC 7102]
MKLTFLSKTFGALFLIALAAIGSVGLQKPADAQLQAQTEPAQNACSIASAQVPESVFDGVNLSAEQFAAYDAVTKRYDDEVVSRLTAKATKVIKPNAVVGFFQRQGVEIPPQLQETIASEAGNSKPAQIDSLTAKYGQHGSFIPEKTLVYNQELFEEFQKESQILLLQILAVMNPEQQQKYQQNQEAFRRSDKACGIDNSPFIKVGDSYELGGYY